jgi:two-component system sensor histidine kinase RegB
LASAADAASLISACVPFTPARDLLIFAAVRVTNKLVASTTTLATADDLGLRSLVRLRWIGALGQVLTLIAARTWLSLDVDAPIVAAVIAVSAASNVALARVRTNKARAVALAICVDVALLTILLAFSGAAANPFSVVYSVYVAMAARLTSTRTTAAIWLLSTACFGSLFLFASPHAEHHEGGAMGAHYLGMWVAYSLASALTGYFVARVTGTLHQLQRASQAAQRLATMSTLAASAAHELGSPLSTIAVVAEDVGGDEGRLILKELARCRAIVRDLGAGTGATAGDEMRELRLADIVSAASADLDHRAAITIDVDEQASVVLPKTALLRTVRNLLANAAQAAEHRVTVSARAEADRCTIAIADDGGGMPTEVLERLGEPYFTTKPDGNGLGVYLATVFAEAVGGELHVESDASGTRVRLGLPRRMGA